VAAQEFHFRHFLATIGTSNLAMGLHTVLYPWLVVGVLDQSPSRLGLAQLAVLLPNLLFILPGGVISDRRHRGAWLSRLYLLYLFPIAILIGAALSGELTFSLLLMFGMVFGTVSAFVQPARESLLGYTAQGVMHQAVAKVVMVQFIAQGIGFVLAGQLETLGLTVLLIVQMLMFMLSSVLIKRSHPQLEIERDIESGNESSKENTAAEKRETLQELRAGFALFLTDKALLHLLLLVTATGFLAFGVYLVGMPLLAREAYQGGAGLYATLQVTFTMGIVAANFVVSRQKNTFKRPGRLMIISFLGRGGLVSVIALMPNFWILFPVIFAWGAFSGMSMTLGRTILHNQVPHSHRSRAASVYQLCLFAGAPLGAWACGYAIEQVGLSQTFTVIAVLTLVVSIIAATVSPLWTLKAAKSE
jgi:MFS family permease|tara:strand:- start:4844 stop:6094 length:1251 start_codon:yes stop_codon:yes gene_type:complete